MLTGKIKWYNRIKGFGFIESESGEDIFIHRSGLENPHMNITDGQEVSFETQNGEKGLSAINVKILS